MSTHRVDILDEIRRVATELGRPPSRTEFKAATGISESRILGQHPTWNAAVIAAGLQPNEGNRPVTRDILFADWGNVVRLRRGIPPRSAYRRDGTHSPTVFDKRIGAWSTIPEAFREWASGRPEWSDVVTLLPVPRQRPAMTNPLSLAEQPVAAKVGAAAATRRPVLTGRPTYGNPINFRGLRHEPVNESGVVFLFGVVARELGFLVEALQAGYPDCEAKRQVGPGKWQRVRIEFEYESRNFRDHGHQPAGCDMIVCWRHNWPDCPEHIEVLALADAIRTLAAADDAV
jgi:hypothetical protein